MYIADISNSTTSAVRRGTSRDSSPCLDIGSIFGVVKSYVPSRNVLDILESVVVLSDGSKGDTVSVVKNAVFH